MIRVLATKLQAAPASASKNAPGTLALTARNDTTRIIAARNATVSVRNEEGVLLGNWRYSPTPHELILGLQQCVHPPGSEFSFVIELSDDALLELAKPGQPRYEIRGEFFSHRALRFCSVPLSVACKRQQNLTSLETYEHFSLSGNSRRDDMDRVITSASLLVGRKRSVEFSFEDSAVPFHFAASVTAAPDFCGLVGIRPTLQLEQGTTEESSFTRKRIFTSFAPGGPLSFSSANFSVSASQLPKASLEVFVDVFEKIDSFTVSGRLDERDISGSKKGKKK